MGMDDFLIGVAIIVSGATILAIAKMIIAYLRIRNKLCAWHRENVTMLMYVVDPILEFVREDSLKNGIKVNGRYARARGYLDKFFEEDVEFRKEGKI